MTAYPGFERIALDENKPAPQVYTVMCHHANPSVFREEATDFAAVVAYTTINCQMVKFPEISDTELLHRIAYIGKCPDCGKEYRYVTNLVRRVKEQ